MPVRARFDLKSLSRKLSSDVKKARRGAHGLRKRPPPPSMVMLSLRVQSLAIYGVTMSANSQKETLDRVQKISVLVAFAEARIKVRRKHSDTSF